VTRERTEYLIVGNGTAAVAAVESIREVDGRGRIVLFSREPHPAYSRPLISHLLCGEIGEERMYCRGRDFYRRNRVDARLGDEVVSIDPEARVVRSASGESVAFEKLLLATGARPVAPPIPGAGGRGVFTFTTLGDARRISAFVEGEGVRRAVVIGGGLIGVKAAEALAALDVAVTVVELEDRVLPLSLDETAAAYAAEAMEEAGVELRCGRRAERVLTGGGGADPRSQAGGRGAPQTPGAQAHEAQARGAEEAGGSGASRARVTGVVVAGEEMPCEIVIIAAGVSPEAGLAEGAGLETGGGVLIDERCETSAAGIFAAGDVACFGSRLSNGPRPLPIWPSAARQGAVAGRNMAGAGARLEAEFAMNATELFGLPMISVGLATASGASFEVLERRDDARRAYRRVVLRDGRIVGALFTAEIDRAGIFTGLIRERVDVSPIEDLLLSDEFGLVVLPAEYRKHVVRGEAMEV